MTDCRRNATLTIVTGVIVSGVKEVKSEIQHIIKHFRFRHCPSATACRSRVTLLVMKRHLQISKTHFVTIDEVTHVFVTIVAVLSDVTCNEAITGCDKSCLHDLSPLLNVLMLTSTIAKPKKVNQLTELFWRNKDQSIR